MQAALLIEGVSKRYAEHVAVDDLSLVVPEGTIYGILGPNGAGKSSTIRMAMGIISRDGGRIRLLGEDPERSREVLRRVGYLPEERGLYKKMTVLEVIVFFARLKGMGAGAARREGTAWVDRMGLGEWRSAKVETLSKGMQQKVQFITTVLHQPDLLVLDEPTSGLDPVNQEVLRDTILGVRRAGRTVVLSTHSMEQAEQLCEHVCIIAAGRKVLDGRLREIQRANAGNRYTVEFESPSPTIEPLLRRSRWFSHVEPRGEAWEVELGADTDTREVLRVLATAEVPLIRFTRIEPSLHEIFVSRVGQATSPQRRPEPVHA
jgi:ABC-2 type transport system ATP-binding protein